LLPNLRVGKVLKRTVGIDFGTSTTLVSLRESGVHAKVLSLGKLNPWIPSIVGLDESGKFLIGEDALKLAPERILYSAKSLIGNRIEEIGLCGTTLRTTEVVKAIINQAMQRANKLVPGIFDNSDVYVSCPAGWTYMERRVLANIYADLGLDIDVGDFIDEPVAASLHWKNEYWQSAKGDIQGKTLVYDAGGGTLDIALVEVGIRREFTVLSTEGLAISGDYLDNDVSSELEKQLQFSDLEKTYLPNLGMRAREIKEGLSTQKKREIPLGKGFDSVVSMDRSTLELLFAWQLDASFRRAQATVRAAEIRTERGKDPVMIREADWSMLSHSIRFVALVGGMSQIPIVTEQAKSVFPNATVEVLSNPQSSVVLGLTHGREVEQLNLPRPPVRFIAEYYDGIKQKSEVIYEAFTPLYDGNQILRGQSFLGRSWTKTCGKMSSRLSVSIRAEAPNRSRSRLKFLDKSSGRFYDSFNLEAGPGESVNFKMYANGDLVLRGGTSKNQHLELRLAKWPKARESMIIEVSVPKAFSNSYRFGEAWRNR
jgi:actin-like ATPase involved in cell morphogenesis